MRDGTAPVVRREDYATPAFWIRRVELTFDLDPAKTIVASRLHVERNPEQPPQALRLHGEGLNLLRIQADGASVAFRHDGEVSVQAVTTTGIYCVPSCSARPQPGHVVPYPSPAAAEAGPRAGFSGPRRRA